VNAADTGKTRGECAAASVREDDRPTTGTSGDPPGPIPPFVAPLVAEGEQHDVAVRPTGATPSATTLLDALDAEANEGAEDEPLEGQSCFDDRAPTV
jgi:hypothetical protein